MPPLNILAIKGLFYLFFLLVVLFSNVESSYSQDGPGDFYVGKKKDVSSDPLSRQKRTESEDHIHRTQLCDHSIRFNKNFVLTDEKTLRQEKAKDSYVYKEIVAPGAKLEGGSPKLRVNPQDKDRLNVNVVQFQVRPGSRSNLEHMQPGDMKKAKQTLQAWVEAGAKVPPEGEGFNSKSTTGFRLDNQGTITEVVNGQTKTFYNLQLQKNMSPGSRAQSKSVAHVQIPVELFSHKKGRDFNAGKAVTPDVGGTKYLKSALTKSLNEGNPIHVYSFSETVQEFESRSGDNGMSRAAVRQTP